MRASLTWMRETLVHAKNVVYLSKLDGLPLSPPLMYMHIMYMYINLLELVFDICDGVWPGETISFRMDVCISCALSLDLTSSQFSPCIFLHLFPLAIQVIL